MLELYEYQCVILSPLAVLPLTADVWVDNIYFRHSLGFSLAEVTATETPQAPLHVHMGASYISKVSIQGDGISDTAALWIFPTANVLMMGAFLRYSRSNLGVMLRRQIRA